MSIVKVSDHYVFCIEFKFYDIKDLLTLKISSKVDFFSVMGSDLVSKNITVR